jgi:uncharacterized repeat protein (TIGR01451 family)
LLSPLATLADTLTDLFLTGVNQSIAVDPTTNRVFVTNVATGGGAAGLYVFEGATHVRQQLPLDSTGFVAVDAVAGKVYVTNNNHSYMFVYDSVTLSRVTVPVGASPAAVAVNPATNRIYTVHAAAGTVTVVDGATLTTSTVTVGAEPRAIAVNPTTNKIYVTNKAGNSLSVVDGANHAVVNVALGSAPEAVAVDPVLNKIYVAMLAANTLVVVDGATHGTTSIPVSASPLAVAVNPVDHKVYVGAFGGGPGASNVDVIDGNSLVKVATLTGGAAVAVVPTTRKAYSGGTDGAGCRQIVCPVGPITVVDGATDTVSQTFTGVGASGIAVNPVTNRIYISYNASSGSTFYGGVRMIDGASETRTTLPIGVVQPVAVNPVTNRVYAGNGAHVQVFEGESDALVVSLPIAAGSMFAVDPLANKIYVANSGIADSVTVIDGATHGTTTVTVGRQPNVVAVNPLTNRIYTTSIPDDTVTVVNGTTLATATIPVGDYPERLAVDVVRNLVYVTNRGSGSVSIIDGATNVATPLPVGTAPSWVAVDPMTGKVFVALYGENAVAVFTPPGNVVTKIPVGAAPHELAFNPVTRRVYVMNLDAHTVSLINADTNNVLGTVTVPAEAVSLVVDPGTNKVYVGSGSVGPSNDILTVIDGTTQKTHPVTVNTGYHNLAVNPISRRVYLGSQGATGLTVVSDPRQVMGPAAAITPLPGHKSSSLTPTFTFTAGSGLNGDPARALFYQVDTYAGAWKRAGGGGPFSATLPQLTPGTHVLYAFAVDAHSARGNSPVTGPIAAYAFTVTTECVNVTCIDLSVEHTVVAPAAGGTQKDVAFQVTVTNHSSAAATSVVLTDLIPAGSTFVWATPGCSQAGGTVTCPVGSLAANATYQAWVVARPTTPGTATNTATVSATQFDPQAVNNQTTANVPVTASPAGVPVLRYRLYSDVTKEHHFTTDLNEYTVLGGNGNWVQEGTVGKVLDNPGSFNGIEAVPYYRLYDTATRWHHWTTDANEYYTLSQFAHWKAEGVDGYVLPTQAAGTVELYRLHYPFLPGLHHWTIDANEYNTLVSSFGWQGEPGAGYVVQ